LGSAALFPSCAPRELKSTVPNASPFAAAMTSPPWLAGLRSVGGLTPPGPICPCLLLQEVKGRVNFYFQEKVIPSLLLIAKSIPPSVLPSNLSYPPFLWIQKKKYKKEFLKVKIKFKSMKTKPEKDIFFNERFSSVHLLFLNVFYHFDFLKFD